MLKQSCFGESATGTFASCGTARGTPSPYPELRFSSCGTARKTPAPSSCYVNSNERSIHQHEERAATR
jgi:hypothetical protein